jgi:monoamine oxidase
LGRLDLIVVGAGAAGLAAARRARELGLEVMVLEAKDRIGGRAHTDRATFGLPWDRGAHWLHDARRNPFVRFADAQGFAYERTPVPRRLWSDGWADAALEAELEDYYARAFAAVAAAGAAGLDVAAAEVIPPHPRFRAMADSWLAALAGVDPERLSTRDYARYEGGGGNWRVVDGYGALLARFGKGLPVTLDARVLRIRWGGAAVSVETGRGTLEGRTAVVTASTSVLAAGGIVFEPPLPARKQEALAAVPLGEANKVAIAFEPGLFAPDDRYHLHIETRTREAIRFEFRPFGRELAQGYLAGRFAAELEAAGPAAMADFALGQLVRVFGAGLRRRVRAVATTAWCGDPVIRGGYSCALPGLADCRPRLAEPLADRVFFAGEACSLTAYGTVHGAAQTGSATAEAIARQLRGAPAAAPGGQLQDAYRHRS